MFAGRDPEIVPAAVLVAGTGAEVNVLGATTGAAVDTISVVVVGAGGAGEDGETGQTVVYREMVSVVSFPTLAGQSVTSGAQEVTVYVVVAQTVEVVYSALEMLVMWVEVDVGALSTGDEVIVVAVVGLVLVVWIVTVALEVGVEVPEVCVSVYTIQEHADEAAATSQLLKSVGTAAAAVVVPEMKS